jgi:glycosyltransferase involved in cell wall biosynthesis
MLSVDDKPSITLFYSSNLGKFKDEIMSINYPEITYVVHNKNQSKILLYLSSFVLGKNKFTCDIPIGYKLDAIFPIIDYPIQSKKVDTLQIAWIPDFQHLFYPHYFSFTNRFLRDLRFRWIAKRSDALILSSFDAKKHFDDNYASNATLPVKVQQFISVLEVPSEGMVNQVKLKYGIEKSYFIVCNQFYEHKNHLLVFDAIRVLKIRNIDFQVVFTGRMNDYRNPSYIKKIQKYISDHQLLDNSIFLGVINRTDQLALMKGAKAVIQPSKFEGWSTVNEDAKSLGKFVLASSIPVNIEQMQEKSAFFEIDNYSALSELMYNVLNDIDKTENWDSIEVRGKKFAQGFIDFIQTVL